MDKTSDKVGTFQYVILLIITKNTIILNGSILLIVECLKIRFFRLVDIRNP